MLRADRRVVVSHVTTGPPSGFNPLPRPPHTCHPNRPTAMKIAMPPMKK